jgi:hypothetical protein
MNEPRDHHYLPQFYLRNWCAPDGLLVRYLRTQAKGVVDKRVSPKTTAYRKDLYALSNVRDEIKQFVEKHVTAQIDHRGASALQKMTDTRSADSLTGEDRLAWVQFLVSLPIRNPDAVADIKETTTEQLMEKAITMAAKDDPDLAKDASFKAEFLQSVEEDPEASFLSANSGLLVIMELMSNPEYHEIFLKMEWWVHDFSNSGISLITCDRPFVNARGLSHPRCLIYLPIGPYLGFFASPDPIKRSQISRQNRKFVGKTMNRWEASQAADYIYASDRKHTPLAKKYL